MVLFLASKFLRTGKYFIEHFIRIHKLNAVFLLVFRVSKYVEHLNSHENTIKDNTADETDQVDNLKLKKHLIVKQFTHNDKKKKKVRQPLKKNHFCDFCNKVNCLHSNQYCNLIAFFLCLKGFNSVSLLSAHIRVHTGERPFVCKLCTKTFTTQGGLDLHVRRHSGYKPYRCIECNRGFVESSNLKVHMR